MSLCHITVRELSFLWGEWLLFVTSNLHCFSGPHFAQTQKGFDPLFPPPQKTCPLPFTSKTNHLSYKIKVPKRPIMKLRQMLFKLWPPFLDLRTNCAPPLLGSQQKKDCPLMPLILIHREHFLLLAKCSPCKVFVSQVCQI